MKKRCIIVALSMMIAALLISSCAVAPIVSSTEKQITSSEIATSSSEIIEATTAMTEASTPTVAGISAKVDPVLPTDLEDVYFGSKSNEDIYQMVMNSNNAVVVKSIFDEVIQYYKVAVEVFAHDTSPDGDDKKIVMFELHKYFESLGIETYFWGKGTVIIVNKSQLDKLGAIPGHETYSVGYALYELPLTTPFYSESNIRMAREKYQNTDECLFQINLYGLGGGNGGMWTNEIYYRFYTADQEVDYNIVIDFVNNGLKSYREKLIQYTKIDAEKCEYDEQGAIYAKLPRRMYLTLTEEELERVLNSKSYITWIDFIDLNAVAEAY